MRCNMHLLICFWRKTLIMCNRSSILIMELQLKRLHEYKRQRPCFSFQIIIIHWRRTMLSDMVSRMSSYPLTNRLIGNTARHMVSNRPHWIGLCSLRKDMNKYDKELLVPCWMVSSIHFGIIYFLLRLDDGNKD